MALKCRSLQERDADCGSCLPDCGRNSADTRAAYGLDSFSFRIIRLRILERRLPESHGYIFRFIRRFFRQDTEEQEDVHNSVQRRIFHSSPSWLMCHKLRSRL